MASGAYNRVTLVGNLTRDVELRFTQNETPVTDIGLAINQRRKDRSGNWVDDPVFVDGITLWGKTAEVADQYLGKGDLVLIEGRLKLDSWEDDGKKRSKLKIVGERMQMLGSSKKQGGQANRGDEQQDQDVAQHYGESYFIAAGDVGEPPF